MVLHDWRSLDCIKSGENDLQVWAIRLDIVNRIRRSNSPVEFCLSISLHHVISPSFSLASHLLHLLHVLVTFSLSFPHLVHTQSWSSASIRLPVCCAQCAALSLSFSPKSSSSLCPIPLSPNPSTVVYTHRSLDVTNQLSGLLYHP